MAVTYIESEEGGINNVSKGNFISRSERTYIFVR